MKIEGKIVIFIGNEVSGTYEIYRGTPTLRAIKGYLKKKSCDGDLETRAYLYLYESELGPVYQEIEGEDMRHIPETSIF